MKIEDIRFMVDMGFLDPRADEFTAYVLMADLDRDSIVKQRALAIWRETKKYGDSWQIITAMNEVEREALRERIFQKHEATIRVGAA